LCFSGRFVIPMAAEKDIDAGRASASSPLSHADLALHEQRHISYIYPVLFHEIYLPPSCPALDALVNRLVMLYLSLSSTPGSRPQQLSQEQEQTQQITSPTSQITLPTYPCSRSISDALPTNRLQEKERKNKSAGTHESSYVARGGGRGARGGGVDKERG
jgi:hypothetical protein